MLGTADFDKVCISENDFRFVVLSVFDDLKCHGLGVGRNLMLMIEEASI